MLIATLIVRYNTIVIKGHARGGTKITIALARCHSKLKFELIMKYDHEIDVDQEFEELMIRVNVAICIGAGPAGSMLMIKGSIMKMSTVTIATSQVQPIASLLDIRKEYADAVCVCARCKQFMVLVVAC